MKTVPTVYLGRIFLVALALVSTAMAATVDVTQAGAVGDGATLNTAALQKAIDTCSAEGGGVLVFPAGRYLTGTIELKDGVTLRLDAEAVLLGSTNAADYRNVDPFMAGDGIPQGYALIVAVNAQRVGLEGTGTIDGQGAAVKAAQAPYAVRPFLVRWIRCADITVRDVHLRNSGSWGMHFFQSRNATVERVTIRNRGLGNNDGLDIDSCETVRIRDCDIDSGDDAICLKATSAQPCRDILVTGCKLQTACNALKLGTESLGDYENIRISDCAVRDTGMAGIAIYSVDGAHTHDVTISDVTMDGINVPISIRLGARLKTFRAGDQAKPPGTLRDVTIKNVRAGRVGRIGVLVNGIPGHNVENLTLENIAITLPGGGTAEDAPLPLPEKEAAYPEMNMFGKVLPAYGFYLRHVRGVTFKNVRTSLATPDARPEKIFIDVEGVVPAGFAPPSPAAGPAASAAPAPQAVAAGHTASLLPRLPGHGLAQHPFLYAGEWDYRKPEQTMFLVREGQVVWTYSIPLKTPDGTLQEWGDATLLSNGNIVFSRKTGAGIVTPEKKLLWNYDAPKGTEIHVAQPLGLERVMLVQNGDPAKLMIVNITTGETEKELKLPTGNPAKPHYQFRRVRMTKAGTFLAAHMDNNKVAEYDASGKELWAVAVLSPWAAVRLPNGNTLVSSNYGFVRELNPKGDTVWEFTKEDAAAAGLRTFVIQEVNRLANGHTVFSSWCANGLKDPQEWPASVQILEVTSDKKIVWALRSWDDPADFGPATVIQLLDEPGVPENGDLLR